MDNRTRSDIAIILGSILLAILSLSTLGNLTVDSSTDAFLPDSTSVVSVNREIERQFGAMDAIIVGISAKEGDVLNSHALRFIASLTDQIGALEGVANAISLTNTEHMQAGVDGFEAVPLVPGYDDDSLTLLRQRLEEWPEVYGGTLISSDRTMAAIIVQPEAALPQEQQDVVIDAIQSLIGSLEEDGYAYSMVGLPLVKQQINRSLLSDMTILAPIVGLLIILVLFFSFRRVAGIVLPLIGLVLSAAVTLGIMALLDITFTMATMLVPVLLLIVGSAYAIHVMSHFYEEVAHLNRSVDSQETRRIISDVSRRNRLPIIMAGATTAAGFIAQFTSPLGPFRTFGLLSAIGVILSQLSALYLLPAMLRITYRKGIDPLRIHAEREQAREYKGHPIFALFEKIATKGRIPLSILSIALAITTVALLPNIKTGTNMIDFFNPSTDLVSDTRRFNQKMNGSGMITVMIESPKKGEILQPDFLVSLEKFSEKMAASPGVGKVQSLIPYIKRINLIMNQDTPPYAQEPQEEVEFDFFSGSFGFGDIEATDEPEATPESVETWDPQTYLEIPTDPAKYGWSTNEDLQHLMAQYLLLYAGNLDHFIDDELEPSATLVTIQLTHSATETLRTLSSQIKTYWDTQIPQGWNYSIGGGDAISLALTDLVTKSQIYSLVGALVIVWLLVSLIFRSPVAGLIGLVPVLFALMGIFSLMSILSIPLDIITSLLAALAIGIGVDYAIHFLSACKRQACSNEVAGEGLGAVMRTTGRAIVINAASVTIGFSGLIFSRFVPIKQMGILFCISMVFAGLSSLTVLPMVLKTVKPKFLTNERRGSL